MNQKIYILLPFIIVAHIAKLCDCWEYCKPNIEWKLCYAKNEHAEYINHTVCVPSKAFDNTVDYISERFLAHVPLTRKFQRVLVEIHNNYRNRVASGNEIKNGTDGDIKPYPAAARMRDLIWDNELSYVAHVHTRQVKMGHDKCRSTQRYRYSGQNLGWKGTKNYNNIMEFVQSTLEEMYLEKDKIPDPTATVAQFTNDLKKYHVGHFTAFVNDRMSRMGCAVAIGANCRSNSSPTAKLHAWCYYLGCNYDSTNLNNQYIYIASPKPASRCKDWNTVPSTKYKHLCHNTGVYFDPLKAPGP